MTIKMKRLLIVGAFIIVAAVIAATICIASGSNEPGVIEIEPVELKVGKYYLQRESGPDKTEYIEIYDDNTIQFFGEYWEYFDEKHHTRNAEEFDPLNVFYPYCFTIPGNSIALGLKNQEEASYHGIYLCTYVQ